MELLGANWVVCWSGSTSRVAQSGSSGVGKAAHEHLAGVQTILGEGRSFRRGDGVDAR